MKHSLNNKGFSLIEIVIVMVIMTFFATLGAQTIRQAVQNKGKIDARLKTESMVFDALRIMATDLEKAFHYTNPFYELDKAALIGSKTATPTANPNNPGPQTIPPKPLQLTQFIGKADRMDFTTLNHYRTTANSQESNQIEVGYFIKNCRPRGGSKKDRTAPCLWRRTALTIDDEVDKDGEEVVLIENITEFKLEYLSEDPNDKDWKHEWKSDRNGSAQTRDKFPYMVKITLEVFDSNNKNIGRFKQTVIANLRFPNNADPTKMFKGNQQQQQPQGAPGGNQ